MFVEGEKTFPPVDRGRGGAKNMVFPNPLFPKVNVGWWTALYLKGDEAPKTDEKASTVAVLDTASPRPASFSTPNPDRGKSVWVEWL